MENDDVDELEWLDYVKIDNFIVDPEAKVKAGVVVKRSDGEDREQELTDEDLTLLPARIFAYSLRDRKFIHTDVRYLKLPQNVPDPFSELKIPEQDRLLIRKTVRDHFEKKQIHR